MKEGLKKRPVCHILQILEQFRIVLRWMARRSCGWIDIVRCWLQHISGTCSWLLIMPGRDAPLMQNSALCRIGSSPTTSSILSQIRQARVYKRSSPSPSSKRRKQGYWQRQEFSCGCKSSTATPSGKTPVHWVSPSHPWCSLWICLSRRSKLGTPQDLGLGSAPPHLADGRSQLMGVGWRVSLLHKWESHY